MPFADTQCGFKAFTRAAAQTVFQLQTIERWGFDPEILFIALKRGFQVVEVPVSWAHDERTRMSYLKDGMQMLKELAIVRWNAFTGRYNKKIETIAARRRDALDARSRDFFTISYHLSQTPRRVGDTRFSSLLDHFPSPGCTSPHEAKVMRNHRHVDRHGLRKIRHRHCHHDGSVCMFRAVDENVDVRACSRRPDCKLRRTKSPVRPDADWSSCSHAAVWR